MRPTDGVPCCVFLEGHGTLDGLRRDQHGQGKGPSPWEHSTFGSGGKKARRWGWEQRENSSAGQVGGSGLNPTGGSSAGRGSLVRVLTFQQGLRVEGTKERSGLQ